MLLLFRANTLTTYLGLLALLLKVFGAAMGQSEPVAVGFRTALGVGKELEKVTLSSVKCPKKTPSFCLFLANGNSTTLFLMRHSLILVIVDLDCILLGALHRLNLCFFFSCAFLLNAGVVSHV